MIKVGLMGHGKAGQAVAQVLLEEPEISGTARTIADSLAIDNDRITSLGLGGIVSYHEDMFGFAYRTLRIIHDAIERKAFGTGAAFALTELAGCSKGFHTFDDLLMRKTRSQLAQA